MLSAGTGERIAVFGAAKLLTKLGVTDLAVVTADRAATIAVEAGSLSARGMAAYQVVCALLRQDHTDEAERLAELLGEDANHAWSACCHDVAARAVEAGWIVRVVATSSAMSWVDAAQVKKITGCAVLSEQRRPGQAKRFPPPAQVIVCPATFNTVNKLAAGIMDNYAAGLLCEALASRTPMTIAPMVNNRL